MEKFYTLSLKSYLYHGFHKILYRDFHSLKLRMCEKFSANAQMTHDKNIVNKISSYISKYQTKGFASECPMLCFVIWYKKDESEEERARVGVESWWGQQFSWSHLDHWYLRISVTLTNLTSPSDDWQRQTEQKEQHVKTKISNKVSQTCRRLNKLHYHD